MTASTGKEDPDFDRLAEIAGIDVPDGMVQAAEEGWSIVSIPWSAPPDINVASDVAAAAGTWLQVKINWKYALVYYSASTKAWCTVGRDPNGPRRNVGWIDVSIDFTHSYSSQRRRCSNANECSVSYRHAGMGVPRPKMVGTATTSLGHRVEVRQ